MCLNDYNILLIPSHQPTSSTTRMILTQLISHGNAKLKMATTRSTVIEAWQFISDARAFNAMYTESIADDGDIIEFSNMCRASGNLTGVLEEVFPALVDCATRDIELGCGDISAELDAAIHRRTLNDVIYHYRRVMMETVR